MKHAKCYREGYPRPQFVRDNDTDLCGEWDFAFDDEDRGESEGWFEQFPEGKKIVVPFDYRTEKSGVAENTEHVRVWYDRTIVYSAEEVRKKRLILHFEGCDYCTKVWINGQYVGDHRGGYCRFSFDITREARRSGGKVRITVRAEDFPNACQPRGKQSDIGRSVGCWYRCTTGIWKKVWSEFVPEIALETVRITPSLREGYVKFEAAVGTFSEGLCLRIVVSYDGKTVSDTTSSFCRRTLCVKAGLYHDGELFRIRYWTPEKPDLYDVEFFLLRGEEVTDEVGSYFGIAECVASKNAVLLNEDHYYLRMVLFQGYHSESGMTAPDEEALRSDILLAKRLGFNGIRMHQKIEDERFYYYVDILGMAIWCEMPSAYEFGAETVEKLSSEWTEVVRQHYNHPCILAWVPLNESWGVPRIRSDRSQQALSLALYHITKAYDSRRLVISNDGWEHTKSDLVTLHNYEQNSDSLYRFYENTEAILKGGNAARYSQLRLPFAEGYEYEGQPVLITEFAGIGYRSGEAEGWGYGKCVSGAEEFVLRLKSLVTALRKIDGICGFCITQLTDVETELNGLAEIDRTLKAPEERLRDAISAE